MRRHLITIMLFLLPLSHATASEWQLRRDQANVRIYQQATKTGYPLTRGETTVNVSLVSLLSLMHNPATCPQWVYACKQSRLVKQYDARQRLDYTVIDSPLWYADRDMYIHSAASFNPQTKTFTIRLTGKENHDQGQPGRVRIRNLYGLWHLQQTAPDKTIVRYQLHGNPQLPASPLLNIYMVESVFQTLHKLGALVQNPRYNNAAPAFIQSLCQYQDFRTALQQHCKKRD